MYLVPTVVAFITGNPVVVLGVVYVIVEILVVVLKLPAPSIDATLVVPP